VLKSGHLTTQTGAPKVAKKGNIRGALTTGAIPKDSVLSFKPGIGWQHVATGTLSGSDTFGNQAQAMIYASSTSMNAATVASLPGNSLSNPRGGAASGVGMMAPMPSGGMHLSSKTNAGVSPDKMIDPGSHAYVSSIKLRLMLRNAPDLQTRIKLQELQDRLLNKSHISLGNSKGNKSTKRQTKSQHGSRPHFPSL
jgi:hypothetical protein